MVRTRHSAFASRAKLHVRVVLEEGAYAHLDLGEVQDAVLQLEGFGVNGLRGAEHLTQTHAEPGVTSDHGLSPEDLAAIRAVVSHESGALGPKAVHAMVLIILRARLGVTNRITRDDSAIDGDQLLQAVLPEADLQLLSRFKASIDGRPDPGSRFMKHWVPLSIQDPLLLRIVLYTAACFLHETGRIPKTLTCDTAIMSTSQMVIDSWVS
ncbi:hypothetical protein ESCO_005755 [Escovopsis weberi]|uniref:Uncharacterized protein n=1 Tax=Escovopsis weberi TaxID=150374 RepID=A0A0M9VUH5_ESCWE|nr:hypothetical protein ESCO_005755 [Escovopsis weberi]